LSKYIQVHGRVLKVSWASHVIHCRRQNVWLYSRTMYRKVRGYGQMKVRLKYIG